MKDNNEQEKGISTKTVVIILAVIFIIWFMIGFGPFILIKDHQTSGLLGDTFGAVNSLFSAMAFVGLIYTIFLQRTELKLQRLELEETRKELARSATAQEESHAALKAQVLSMSQTAKINALNSLIQANDLLMARGTLNSFGIEQCKQKMFKFSSLLESTLQEIESN